MSYLQIERLVVRRMKAMMKAMMKAIITWIESGITPSDNSGRVVVPKAWIGKEAIVTLKEKENKTKDRKSSFLLI